MTTNNHPANDPVSLDRLHQIRETLSKAAAQSDGGNIGYAMADAVKVIDGAIAAFGAAPVGEVIEQQSGVMMDGLFVSEKPTYRNIKGIHKMKMMPLGTKFYTVPPAPVVPEEITSASAPEIFEIAAEAERLGLRGTYASYAVGWNACRAAMLQAGNSPVTPDGLALVPKRLTAENGAKGVLSGEFSETKFINCPECFGDDECETCDGSGRIEITVPVSWTNIKAIWAKGVEHFEAAPQQENV
ncbi:hypothetical protein [Citrobacter portucalensis]|uniref:hypothetical protein n=1 Tax=Citrobacter portucalensis TaxID=1639133 RepID=UPI003B23300A